nr:hypothetical protein [Micromonospora sp. DSM 115978]
MAGSDLGELDLTLRRLTAAVSSNAAALLEVEASPGRSLLDPSALTGRSLSLATEILGRLGQAWQAYAALKD